MKAHFQAKSSDARSVAELIETAYQGVLDLDQVTLEILSDQAVSTSPKFMGIAYNRS